jgi:NAD(P) transhydrogenase subunit alpha
LKIGVPKEISPGERRVALVPDGLAPFKEMGLEIYIESGAGQSALLPDSLYEDAGATILMDPVSLYGTADAVLKVAPPLMNDIVGHHERELIKEGSVLIGLLQPLDHVELVNALASNGISSFSMDSIPRTARSQSMDALSSMASLAGYKAALIAVNSLNRFAPMMITAAGTLAPAKGLVIGAGVSGLQAIATARRIGAVMYGYDVRPAVRDQVRSLGANFIEAAVVIEESEHSTGYAKELTSETQQRERDVLHEHVLDSDFVITTAAVPGKPAPKIVTEEMVKGMRPGTVIVDIAAETGGNCELSQPGKEIIAHDVIIHAPLDIPSSMSVHASRMYSRNVSNFLLNLLKDGEFVPDFDDDIVKTSCVTHNYKVRMESIVI